MIHPSFREVTWTTGSADVVFLGTPTDVAGIAFVPGGPARLGA